eukprot:Blabericola_migrator_1__7946@NODE_4075_length_1345_cov_188_216745_g2515_i0_p2_GENE_NODE_4075_length_1345_cov_188_216745_g2515_i0NODE_4075_length_1345_cov_188_216745_g2515_i0_p2_ORF_typecomplete_len113_score16_49AAA_lid_8/PF17868_1/0_09LIFR_N/PF18207_1/0_59LIFR_N/PF18207_1/5_4e02_NODE_4075_length_1345_cov_188_216745_g2515_i039377
MYTNNNSVCLCVWDMFSKIHTATYVCVCHSGGTKLTHQSNTPTHKHVTPHPYRLILRIGKALLTRLTCVATWILVWCLWTHPSQRTIIVWTLMVYEFWTHPSHPSHTHSEIA